MDLKTIKNRVRDGVVTTSSEYQRDIYLMFANSLMYNRPNSDIYSMAEEVSDEVLYFANQIAKVVIIDDE